MSTNQTALLTVQIRLAMMSKNFGLKTTWGNYPTASTGPGVVNMPYFDATDPVQVQAAMGFGLHEGSHHRYKSDFGLYAKAATLSKLHKGVFNCLDDGRIDFRAMLEYPGIRSDYEAIESLFISRSQKEPANADMPLLAVAYIYLSQFIAVEVLKYKPTRPLFEETTKVAQKLFSESFIKRVQMIAQMGTQASTCHGCWEATLLFVDTVLDELKQQSTSKVEGDEDDSDPEAGDQGDEDDSDPEAGGQGDEDDSDPDAGGNSLGNPSEIDPHDQVVQLAELAPNLDEDLSEVKDKGEQLAQLIKPDSSVASQTPLRPDIQINNNTQKVGKSRHFDGVKTTANLLTQSLIELVETETNIVPSSGRRGKRFILAKKTRYLQGDLRVFRTKAEEKGIDSAISIALDLSGSMAPVEHDAKNACLSVALAVEQIDGAKVCVQSFSGRGNFELISFDEDVEMASGRFDSIKADDGTPMREGLSNAFLSLMGIEAERKTVIVITDGEPDIPCDSTFQLVRDYGMDVFGIYIGNYSKGKKSMDRYFTPHGWIAVQSMFDLKRELFKLAKSTILPAA